MCLSIIACTNDPVKEQKTNQPAAAVVVPKFQADSAFAMIKKQVEFGPRVPGSAAHIACGDWMVSTLKSYGANVIEQKGNVVTFDGKSVPLRNIIAEFNPSAKKRIVLAAHWDTRPFADKDPDESKWKKPIDGANDGGSGVGVLMEIARLLQAQAPKTGVDLIFFDVEDYGTPEFVKNQDDNSVFTWCLGSQYWLRQPHKVGYIAEAGVLLDMVGAKDATFNKEGKSVESAPGMVGRLWNTAAKLGHGGYFRDETVQEIVDDHQFMIMAGIPTANIIDMRPEVKAMGFEGYTFGNFHHTHNDNINVIDRATLKAVGETVMNVVWNF